MARVLHEPEGKLLVEIFYGLALFWETTPIAIGTQLDKALAAQVTTYNLYTHLRTLLFRNRIPLVRHELALSGMINRIIAGIHRVHNTNPNTDTLPRPITYV
jgi:hypothetical protein